jgi:hypothetical protein
VPMPRKSQIVRVRVLVHAGVTILNTNVYVPFLNGVSAASIV